MRLDTTSVQDNGDMPFSVDINDYGDVVAFNAATHKIGKFKAAIKNMSWQGGSLRQYLYNELNSTRYRSWVG